MKRLTVFDVADARGEELDISEKMHALKYSAVAGFWCFFKRLV